MREKSACSRGNKASPFSPISCSLQRPGRSGAAANWHSTDARCAAEAARRSPRSRAGDEAAALRARARVRTCGNETQGKDPPPSLSLSSPFPLFLSLPSSRRSPPLRQTPAERWSHTAIPADGRRDRRERDCAAGMRQPTAPAPQSACGGSSSNGRRSATQRQREERSGAQAQPGGRSGSRRRRESGRERKKNHSLQPPVSPSSFSLSPFAAPALSPGQGPPPGPRAPTCTCCRPPLPLMAAVGELPAAGRRSSPIMHFCITKTLLRVIRRHISVPSGTLSQCFGLRQ